MTKIKLCGLSRPCDIEAANALLPDYIGFVFAKKSRRYVVPEKAKALLPTVRSRAHIITLSRTYVPDEQSEEIAEAITDGIVKLYEYDLLVTLSTLGKKEEIEAALTAFCEKLRLALSFQSGIKTDDACAQKLVRRLDRARIIALTEITLAAIAKLKTNVNQQLLLTWLCTQYRRITWQK